MKSSDRDTWETILSHTGIVISGCAWREKIEIAWIASSGSVEKAEKLIHEVYLRFRKELFEEKLYLKSYSDYQETIIRFYKETIESSFKAFIKLLKGRDKIAWKRVYEKLYIYSDKWLSDRMILGSISNEFFQDS